MTTRGSARLGLLASLFVIGFALMGFEMLGSRYLNPYFGSGITTWACLISVVLFAMMVGYFAGGYAVDAWPGVGLLALCVVLAAACMLIVPQTANWLLQFIIEGLGDGFAGVLTASLALSLLPVAFLSACSPFVVRLLLVDLDAGGKTAGLVYSVSTLGNVAGTLATTFYLIPNFGIRAITTAFGVALAILAVLLFFGKRPLGKGVRTAAVVALLVGPAVAVAWPWPCFAEDPAHDGWAASYPEGPLWVGERLLYTEMGASKVVEWKAGQRRDFWQEPGCGPTAISAFRDSQFIVLCHLGGKLVHLDASGRKIGEFKSAADGEVLRDPNDCHTDGRGGVFFTDAGLFMQGAPATGKVFHLAADGTIRKLLDGVYYANGIAVDFTGKRLLLSEHLARKVWQFDLRDDLTITNRRLFLDVGRYFSADEIDYPETGPDGIEVDREGTIFIPVYGSGRMLAVASDGTVSKLTVRTKFVTNIAISAANAAVVGAFANDRPGLPGWVEVLPRQTLLALVKRTVVAPVR
ncbi:MAG: fused MFS/spermidine synthase [Hyphomicrobiaceae bacterium]|nr:fused MFS/spermidine synthase [Hyphomicrobiaceae bacterium]